MAYGNIDDVRVITGLTVNDISDADLTTLLSIAQRMFFNDVLIFVDGEEITATNAAGTLFKLANAPIASIENGMHPLPTDVTVEAMNPNATDINAIIRTLTVSAINARVGLIQLSEPPASDEIVLASYYYAPVPIQDADADIAINYLAAHLATLRVEDPGMLTIQDLDKNALVIKNNNTRFLDAYERKKAEILGGATFRAVNP